MKKTDAIHKKYMALQGMFWLLFAAEYAYVTPLLEARNFEGYEIGIINAIKYISVIVSQILIATFADKHAKKIQLKTIMLVMTCLGTIATFYFWHFKTGIFVTIIIFIIFGSTYNCLAPLIDSLYIKYKEQGKKIIFNHSRAVGSVTWAFGCIFIGMIADKVGANSVLLLQGIFSVLLLLIIISLDRVEYKEKKSLDIKQLDRETKKEGSHSILWLLKNNPKYSVFLVGIFLAFSGYSLGATFLIDKVQSVGGGHTEFGIAQFVLAISEVPTALYFMKLRNRLSSDKMMLICSVFVLLLTIGTTLAPNIQTLIIAQSAEMLGFGLYYPAGVYFVMDHLPSSDSVKGMSLMNVASMGLGQAFGTLVSGILKSNLGLMGSMYGGIVVGIISILVMSYMVSINAETEVVGRPVNAES